MGLWAEAIGGLSVFDILHRVLPFCRSMFENDDGWVSMSVWDSKAYAKLHQHSGDQEAAEFALTVNDRLVQNQRDEYDPNPDYIGSFGRNGDSRSTGGCLESIAEGLKVAKTLHDHDRALTYGQVLFLGMQYLMSRQWNPYRIYDPISEHVTSAALDRRSETRLLGSIQCNISPSR